MKPTPLRRKTNTSTRPRTPSPIPPEWEALKPGDILYDSWGYDRTNVNFYVVIRTTQTQVLVQRIDDEEYEGHDAEGISTREGNKAPILPPRPSGDIIRIKKYTRYIPNSSYRSVRIWDGKPKYYSWYA